MMKTNMEASQSCYNRKQDYYQHNIGYFKTRKLKDEKGKRGSNEGLASLVTRLCVDTVRGKQ